jgi:hypothetical protein
MRAGHLVEPFADLIHFSRLIINLAANRAGQAVRPKRVAKAGLHQSSVWFPSAIANPTTDSCNRCESKSRRSVTVRGLCIGRFCREIENQFLAKGCTVTGFGLVHLPYTAASPWPTRMASYTRRSGCARRAGHRGMPVRYEKASSVRSEVQHAGLLQAVAGLAVLLVPGRDQASDRDGGLRHELAHPVGLRLAQPLISAGMRPDGPYRVLPPIEGRCPRAPLSQRQLRSLRLAFASGVTISDLAKRFDVSLRTVRNALKAEVATAEERGAADQKQ